jgi:hypothetical protein
MINYTKTQKGREGRKEKVIKKLMKKEKEKKRETEAGRN